MKVRMGGGAVQSRLLSVGEGAELLQVPKTTIYEWQYRGEGPTCIRIGKYLRFDPDDLARWVAMRKASPRKGGR